MDTEVQIMHSSDSQTVEIHEKSKKEKSLRIFVHIYVPSEYILIRSEEVVSKKEMWERRKFLSYVTSF